MWQKLSSHSWPFLYKKGEKKKHKNKKSVSGAGLDYVSLSHIPCIITSQGNNTGSIEPHCANNEIIEEVSHRLVTHFPLTPSSEPKQHSKSNLISSSYSIN